MCAEHAAGDGASLEQAEAEQHGVAHAAPYRTDGVAARGDALYQHRIDSHADKDQQPLKANSEQGLQVVLSSIAKLPIGERGNGDGR